MEARTPGWRPGHPDVDQDTRMEARTPARGCPYPDEVTSKGRDIPLQVSWVLHGIVITGPQSRGSDQIARHLSSFCSLFEGVGQFDQNGFAIGASHEGEADG